MLLIFFTACEFFHNLSILDLFLVCAGFPVLFYNAILQVINDGIQQKYSCIFSDYYFWESIVSYFKNTTF